MLFDYERPVFNVYNAIVHETDRRIWNKKRALKLTKVCDKVDHALRQCVDVFSEECKNYENPAILKKVLEIHGELLSQKRAQRTSYERYMVCDVCSSIFHKNDKCAHPFHEHYKVLRSKRDLLFERLNKNRW
jgi:hypothetical protein